MDDEIPESVKKSINSVIVSLGEDIISLAMVLAGHNNVNNNDYVSEFDMLDSLRFQLISKNGSARESVKTMQNIITDNETNPYYTIEKTSEIINKSLFTTIQPDFFPEKDLEENKTDEYHCKHRDITCTCDVCIEILEVRKQWITWKPIKSWEIYFVSMFSHTQ